MFQEVARVSSVYGCRDTAAKPPRVRGANTRDGRSVTGWNNIEFPMLRRDVREMTYKQHDLRKDLREIIATIGNLAPSLAKLKSNTASDQEAAIRHCLLSLLNSHSETEDPLDYIENTLLGSKYRIADNVRNVLAMALERSDVCVLRKVDALRCAIDFAEAFNEIELDSWGTCSQDDAYKLALSAFSVAMAIIRP
jgi:hypothetical protein